MLPNKNNILEKFKEYSNIEIIPENVSFSSNKTFCVLRIITVIEVLVLNYNYLKDSLTIDLFNFKDIDLISDVIKGFNFKKINNEFKKFNKEYNISESSSLKVESILISNFLKNENIKKELIYFSLKYKNHKINIKANEFNFNVNIINFTEMKKPIFFNKKNKNYYQLFEFILFQICFKEKYNLTRFTQKNLSLVKLMNY